MNKRIVHQVFEHISRQHPEKTAVETDLATLSYSALNEQADRLAALLRQLGLRKDAIAAAFFEQRLFQLFSLLGIFKSGGIYLPLDKKYNRNHWSELYHTIQPQILLTSHDQLELVKGYNIEFGRNIPQLLDLQLNEQQQLVFTLYTFDGNTYVQTALPEFQTGFDAGIHEDDSCYIFFTSGSTGKPKAVLGKHKSLSHYIHWESGEIGVKEKDRFGQIISYSFDASLKDVFMSLINGATLCIPSEAIKADTGLLVSWMRDQQITLMHMVPTMFRIISGFNMEDDSAAAPFPALRAVMMAGEKLYNRDVLKWRRCHGEATAMYNFYGTTESTVLSTFYKIPAILTGNPADVLCVGQPISNTKILILNDRNELCRIDEKGSIYIRTPFLSKGYFKNEEQTAEKFVQNPLTTDAEIVYRTGDYGKYNTDRDVVVIGREDGMVKLNGVRIDVNSIESAILAQGQIDMIKCMIHEEDTTDAALVCFYKSAKLTVDQLRSYCAGHLSQYEQPAIIFQLDHFPVNANGKVDSVALKSSIAERLAQSGDSMEPASAVEEQLADLWKEVLKTERVSLHQGFLSLGGNSIKQFLLNAKIRMKFGVTLTIEELFVNDTIRKQAACIEGYLQTNKKVEDDRIKPVPRNTAGYPVSNEQFRIWAASQSDEASRAHNMSHTYEVHGNFEVSLFIQALMTVVSRHEALRTSFTVNDEGEVVQRVADHIDLDDVFRYVSPDENMDDDKLQGILQSFSGHVFRLSKAPLFRILLIAHGDDRYSLSTLMHHILGDYTSDQIILAELMQLYDAAQRQEPASLREITVHYKDYVHWIRKKMSGGGLTNAQQFWDKHLAGMERVAKWHKEATEPDYTGSFHYHAFKPELMKLISDYCGSTNRNPMSVLAAALGILVHKTSGQQDVVIGIPINLRSHPDLIGQVGLYLNLLPLRIRVQPQTTAGEVLEAAAKDQVQLMEHAFYPLERIIESYEEQQGYLLTDRIDLYLNFINDTGDLHNAVDGLSFHYQERALKMSKFPICFYISNEKTISFKIEYQSQLFDAAGITRLAERFCYCVEQILTDPELEVKGISLVDKKSLPTFSFNI